MRGKRRSSAASSERKPRTLNKENTKCLGVRKCDASADEQSYTKSTETGCSPWCREFIHQFAGCIILLLFFLKIIVQFHCTRNFVSLGEVADVFNKCVQGTQQWKRKFSLLSLSILRAHSLFSQHREEVSFHSPFPIT